MHIQLILKQHLVLNFWSGGKRCPKALSLEKNELCLEYIKTLFTINAEMFNMNVSTDDLVVRNTILEMIEYYKPVRFYSFR